MSELESTLAAARAALVARRTERGSFTGELSTSALSTATAGMAFALFEPDHPRARAAWRWLCSNQNDDGGWGDTVDSPTNISTTTLAWASLGLARESSDEIRAALADAERWLLGECGDLAPARLAATIRARYGDDQTFSVPILTTCALAGRIGWELVPQLPFELAAVPHQLFRMLNLRVVSYALPALIAIGQVRHFHRPSWNPITRLGRAATKARTLGLLRDIQPTTGGYLEAAPLTSFVAMSLLSMGLREHPVTLEALRFLDETVRQDGSWPIDTNLDTWLTTLSVGALEVEVHDPATLAWLLDQQLASEHAYTHAAPGGWAWTDLSGGVPDADDTAGAILALRTLGASEERCRAAAERGITWLLDLQNGDGGIPTFCRGWGKLPFDRSGSDLTAHALRAFAAWREVMPSEVQVRMAAARRRGVEYLLREQRADGAWIPLWFGNQYEPANENPIYGTSRVLRAIPMTADAAPGWRDAGHRAAQFLLGQQQDDGGFGRRPTIEETALAVEALAEWVGFVETAASCREAVERGVAFLTRATEGGTRFPPAPIGLYFARLWYFEELYPLVFTVSALARARSCLDVPVT